MTIDAGHPHPCHVCGGPVGTFAHGFGSYCGPRTKGQTVYLCHPNDPALPDCYTIFCRSESLDAAIALTNHWLQRQEERRARQADAGGEPEEGDEAVATRAHLLAVREALVALQQGLALWSLPAGDQPAPYEEDLSRIDLSLVRSIEIVDERLN